MRCNHRNRSRGKIRNIAISTLALLSSASLISGTALAGHLGYTHAPAGFVSATDFGPGFNATESTTALQLAFDSGMDIFVPQMASSWITNQLFLTEDNQTILFEEGVVVEALAGAFMGGNDSLLYAESVDNVRLEGYGATLRMRQSDYTQAPYSVAEWRMGIRLHSVTNFDVVGLTVEDTGGDGIYVRGTFSVPDALSEDVTIQDVTINNAYRNGISVISAKNLLIDNVVIVNTSGTAPQVGIDIEPNDPGDTIENVTIQNSIIQSNLGNGIQFAVGDSTQNEPVSGLVQNVTVVGNGGGGLRFTKGALPGFEIRNNLLIGQADDGINVTGGDGSTLQTISYSVSSGNADNDFQGQYALGAGIVTPVPPITLATLDTIFVNTTDITSPLYFALDPSVSTDISLGDSDGSFIGARGVAGDFDADAGIDGFDFLAWQRGESPNNGSAGDLAAWEQFFGEVGTPLSGLAAGVGAVPEPSTSLLLLVGLGFGSLLPRQKRLRS